MVADVRRGRTEREVAMAIDWRIRDAGFERSAFETIVAAGPNAALPHARPGERKLAEGDLVVLDFGGVYDSYCVDLTRTYRWTRAGAGSRGLSAVLKAHDLAIEAVKPGVSRFAIDGAARDSLARRGDGRGVRARHRPRSRHRGARGSADLAVGTEDAEGAQTTRVAPGMVFTIEPGAYLPGWGGVRIEDDVLVTDTGVEVLTDVTTELVEI